MGARHARVKRLRRLAHRRSVRDDERVFVAEGRKVVEAALRSPARVEAVYVDAAHAVSLRPLVAEAEAAGVRVGTLAAGVLDTVADAATPQPVTATVGFVDVPLEELTPGLVLVLVDVRDPGNVGAIVRVADAAGASGVVLCRGCGDLYNPKTVRASAGSLFAVPVVRADDATGVLQALSARNMTTVATVAHGGADYATSPLEPPVALVLGNEAAGLDAALVEACDLRVTVPVAGSAESLNVAMAATVVAFELARRRRTNAHGALSMNP